MTTAHEMGVSMTNESAIERRAERMVGRVEPAAVEVEADPRGHRARERLLGRNGIGPAQDGVVGPPRRVHAGAHQRR